MKSLLFATNNESKINNFKDSLLKENVELFSLKDKGITLDVIEDGKSVIENALKKAMAGYKASNMPTIGMDDGLYLEGVPADLQPGLYVRRVNNKVLTDEEMIKYYTDLVRKYGVFHKLKAKWVYGVALVDINGTIHTYTYEKGGFYFTDKASSIINAGYPLDSISKYEDNDKYFTEVKKDDKQFNNNDVIKFILENIGDGS